MIKVFLAEDEMTIREGIKRRVKWEENGFLFSGEAEDGEKALSMIRKIRPDILITDIKMPFMDGLELCRLVKEEFPEMKILILSGYDDFSYAKQAIRLGVAEYLLKPVTSARLLQSLLEMKEDLEEERAQTLFLEQYEKEAEKDYEILKYQFYNELLSGKGTAYELKQKGESLGLDLEAGAYNFLLYKISASSYDDHMEYRQDYMQVEAFLMEAFEKDKNLIYFDHLAEGAALLITGKTPQEVDRTISKCIRIISKETDASHNLHYFIGIGKNVLDLKDIALSYQYANRAYTYRFLTLGNKVLYGGDIHAGDLEKEKPFSLMDVASNHMDSKVALNFLKSGLKSDIELFVEKFIRSLGENNMDSLMFRQYIILDINFQIVQFLESIGRTREDLQKRFPEFGDIMMFTRSLGKTKQYIIQSFENCMNLRELAAVNKYADMVECAKEFIRIHYNDEDISLNTTAARVNVSPNHFSRIFSQETGITFVEYLTDIRIERAKELLRATNIRISDVGYEVGYKDSHYFYYLFKKMEGCTPKDYRIKVQRKEIR